MSLASPVKQLLFFITLLATIASCEPEEEIIDPTVGLTLQFSTDTVHFDTVFAGTPDEVRNITKRLVVFNPHEKAVNISSITLAGGEASPYALFINGQAATRVNNQELFGGDSLLLLINMQVNPREAELPFLIKDSIRFQVNAVEQDVKLLGYGQDAYFIAKGSIACDQSWNANKPYVLQDTVWVESGCALTIPKGARIYFNNNAALMVEGKLRVLGEKEERVLFSNSRLDIKNRAALWAGIHFLEGSNHNEISYADIRNTINGILIETHDEDTIPDLKITHSKIENTSSSGIHAINADLYASNTLINSSLENVISHVGGGNYTYEHCTIVNFATLGFYSQSPVVYFSNKVMEEEPLQSLKVRLYNNVFWGGGNLFPGSELQFDLEGESNNIDMGYNLIRSVSENEILNTNNNILNTAEGYPEFRRALRYNYKLDSISPAIDRGKDLGILLDLEGNARDENPDIGAYEYVSEE